MDPYPKWVQKRNKQTRGKGNESSPLHAWLENLNTVANDYQTGTHSPAFQTAEYYANSTLYKLFMCIMYKQGSQFFNLIFTLSFYYILK